jgi:hypothetical protein
MSTENLLEIMVLKRKKMCKLYLCVNTNNKLKIFVRIVRDHGSWHTHTHTLICTQTNS